MSGQKHSLRAMGIGLVLAGATLAGPGLSQQISKPTMESFEQQQVDELLKSIAVDSDPLQERLDRFIKSASLKKKQSFIEGKGSITWNDPEFNKAKSSFLKPKIYSPVSACPEGTSGPGCQSCKPKPPICHRHTVTCTRKSDEDPPDCTESHSDCIEGTGTVC